MMDDSLRHRNARCRSCSSPALIGGGAAWLTGRAIAQTWRPLWHVVVYMAAARRGGALRAFRAVRGRRCCRRASYAADTLYLLAVGALAWRMTRAAQMATQYYWLYERTGPLTWRERAAGPRNPPRSGTNSG